MTNLVKLAGDSALGLASINLALRTYAFRLTITHPLCHSLQSPQNSDLVSKQVGSWDLGLTYSRALVPHFARCVKAYLVLQRVLISGQVCCSGWSGSKVLAVQLSTVTQPSSQPLSFTP